MTQKLGVARSTLTRSFCHETKPIINQLIHKYQTGHEGKHMCFVFVQHKKILCWKQKTCTWLHDILWKITNAVGQLVYFFLLATSTTNSDRQISRQTVYRLCDWQPTVMNSVVIHGLCAMIIANTMCCLAVLAHICPMILKHLPSYIISMQICC